MYTCPNCGGKIIGDGYTMVQHCEFSQSETIQDSEPDAGAILCESDEEKAKRLLEQFDELLEPNSVNRKKQLLKDLIDFAQLNYVLLTDCIDKHIK